MGPKRKRGPHDRVVECSSVTRPLGSMDRTTWLCVICNRWQYHHCLELVWNKSTRDWLAQLWFHERCFDASHGLRTQPTDSHWIGPASGTEKSCEGLIQSSLPSSASTTQFGFQCCGVDCYGVTFFRRVEAQYPPPIAAAMTPVANRT